MSLLTSPRFEVSLPAGLLGVPPKSLPHLSPSISQNPALPAATCYPPPKPRTLMLPAAPRGQQRRPLMCPAAPGAQKRRTLMLPAAPRRQKLGTLIHPSAPRGEKPCTSCGAKASYPDSARGSNAWYPGSAWGSGRANYRALMRTSASDRIKATVGADSALSPSSPRGAFGTPDLWVLA